MRCATLGRALLNAGHHVQMVGRDLPGQMMGRMADMGFETSVLPPPDAPFTPQPDDPAHAHWAMVPWAHDAGETRAALHPGTDWLIVDHYAFNARWQRSVKDAATRLMVIDDLFDRPHDGDLLLDQNLGRTARDYTGLIPAHMQALIGPAYALLRPEFVQARDAALAARAARPPTVSHLLIAMGGVDAQNVTGALLQALTRTPPPDLGRVTVVMGAQAPGLAAVRRALSTLPMTHDLRIDTTDIATLMCRADLAIGGAGGTALERCCLGLPSLIVVMAENQHRAAEIMAAAGVARTLADVSNQTQASAQTFDLAAAFAALPPDTLARMQTACAAVTDGMGTARVMAALTAPATGET